MAAGGIDGLVRVWRLPEGELRGEFRASNGRVQHLAFSPDGKKLATAGADGNAMIVDVAAEGDVRLGDAFDRAPVPFAPVRKAPIAHVALASKPHLLVWYADLTLDIWNTAAQRLLDRRSLDYLAGGWAVAVSPDGRLVATTCSNGHEPYNALLFCELEPLATRSVRLPYSTDFYAAALSPDNRRLAVTRADGAIDFYEPATGEKSFSLAGHQASADSLAFSPDGRTLASASRGGDVRLWHLATREELFVIRRIEMSGLPHIDCSPDGHRLAVATGGTDGRGHIFVWPASSPASASAELRPATNGARRRKR